MTTARIQKPPVSRTAILNAGLLMGLAGGAAEVVVVSAYAAVSGTDAGLVARGVSSSIGLVGGSAVSGVAVHMGISLVLGVVLAAAMQTKGGREIPAGAIFPVMMGTLASIWLVNFFVILPAVSPSFVHLLPFAVTLASKLAFGLSAAIAGHALAARTATHSAPSLMLMHC